MKKFCLNFRHINIAVDAENIDETTLAEILKLYRSSSQQIHKPAHNICIPSTQNGNPSLTRPEIIHIFHEEVTRAIRSNLCRNELLAHASCFSYRDLNVMLIGKSGSGKTSLPYLVTKQAGFAPGDEYVWLSDEYGLAYCETLPHHIKEAIAHWYPLYEKRVFTETISKNNVRSFLFSPHCASFEFLAMGFKPSMIVFLIFQEDAPDVLSLVKASELPGLVLESVLSENTPRTTFSKFLNFIGSSNVKLLKLVHSGLSDARRLLLSYLES